MPDEQEADSQGSSLPGPLKIIMTLAAPGLDLDTFGPTDKELLEIDKGVRSVVSMYATGNTPEKIIEQWKDLPQVAERIANRFLRWHQFYLSLCRSDMMNKDVNSEERLQHLIEHFGDKIGEGGIALRYFPFWVERTMALEFVQAVHRDFIKNGGNQAAEENALAQLTHKLDEPVRSVALAMWRAERFSDYREGAKAKASASGCSSAVLLLFLLSLVFFLL